MPSCGLQASLYTDSFPAVLVKVGHGGSGKSVCMMAGAEAPNGFQWKINFGQKSFVSIKNTSIIKVWAAGNRYKLHLSLCPGALCLIKGMGFPPVVRGKVEGSDQQTKREVAA